ncbi:UV-endonuclease UvdE-domain-containing protein [Mycena polygramma]|nr:UV-endonuclease UvdE-domain-containing protein [Mycena polygramma]
MATPTRRSSRFQAREATALSPTLAQVPDTVLTGQKRKRAVESAEHTPEVDEPADKKGGKDTPRKTRQPKPEPTYIIPDVLKKETTFKGRLGYACLNTVLRNKKPAKDAIFCSRTCRLESIKKNGIEWVQELGRKNVEDLLTIIQWNDDNNIRFMRMSSEMFPFASHGVHGYSLEYCAPLLARVGELATKLGHRLTTHPGQFTQLGSPKPEVVTSSVRELEYHCEMMERMGLGADSVMIIHGGGVYGDKTAALLRVKKSITEVLSPNVRARLVLENDEMCYNAEDLLPLCEELDVPFVFDYHHDALFPSSISPSEIIKRANVIWARRGIKPKQHLSEARPGAITLMERRAHSDRCESLPIDLPDDMDLMIEAKDKEQAVLHLYRMYGLHPVTYASLRPPDENQTKETKGRKSAKKQKIVKAEDEEDE